MSQALLKKFGIALTGGIATGKSNISKYLKELGYLVIDADQVARQVVEPGSKGLTSIKDTFGETVIDPNGSLDRAGLRAIIYSDENKRRQLERILHPLIQQRTLEILSDAGYETQPKPWFYEAALIFEKNRQNDFREVWVTICSAEEQLRRLTKRDQCTTQQAQNIIASQLPIAEKANQADLVIDTSGPRNEVRKFVEQQLTLRLPWKD